MPERSILFIAGDLSGDEHSARVALAVQVRHPDWRLHAVGGQRLAAAIAPTGGTLVGDSGGCGVIGFASAVALLPRVLRLRRQVLRFLQEQPPDAVLLCDWGAFNGRLLPYLKQHNIRVLYYFPPRSWQRQGKGGLGIAPYVTRVATPFSWSAERLRAVGCEAHWVGHPGLELLRNAPPKVELRQKLGVTHDYLLIALLPGSRALELQYIAPHIIGAAEKLRADYDAEFVMAVPAETWLHSRLRLPDWIKFANASATDLLQACDAAIVKSGTVTLEAAIAGAPQVVVYEVPPLLRAQWRLTRLGKTIRFVAMPNIILNRAAVPELLGNACRAPHIAAAMAPLLDKTSGQRERMQQDYKEVRNALGAKLPFTATEKTAELLEEMVESSKG